MTIRWWRGVSLAVCMAAAVQTTLLRAQLRVGTGKVDLTPPPAELPDNLNGIHDHIFTRAIVVENHGVKALLMNVDVGNLTPPFAEPLLAQIASTFGIPRENIVLSAVHIHSSMPSLGGPLPGGRPTPHKTTIFLERVNKAVIQAIQEAVASLQPAEVGFGEGKLYLNVNRDAIDPKTRMWAQEPNLEFPSDKTFALIEFRKPNGGAPIAVYMNYAMHAVTMFLRGDMSADFPGVASKYIEDVYGDNMTAVWTQGAEGDQNPLYLRPITAVNEPRIHQEMDPAKGKDDPGEYNAAIMRLFIVGATRPSIPVDAKVAEQAWDVAKSIGVLSAEEAIRVMGTIDHFEANPAVEGATTVVNCPGRKRLDNAREGLEGHYEDGPPVQVQVGALRLGDIAIGHVNGEPYNKIGVEAKLGSPFRNTMIVALTAGGPSGGYMPSDDAYGHFTFQALGTRFKPGCAEPGIVHGIDEILLGDMEGKAK